MRPIKKTNKVMKIFIYTLANITFISMLSALGVSNDELIKVVWVYPIVLHFIFCSYYKHDWFVTVAVLVMGCIPVLNILTLAWFVGAETNVQKTEELEDNLYDHLNTF